MKIETFVEPDKGDELTIVIRMDGFEATCIPWGAIKHVVERQKTEREKQFKTPSADKTKRKLQ